MMPSSYSFRYSSEDSPNRASAARSATISLRIPASPRSVGSHLKARWNMGIATSMVAVTSGVTQVMGSGQLWHLIPASLCSVPSISRAMSATVSGSTSPTTHSSMLSGV